MGKRSAKYNAEKRSKGGNVEVLFNQPWHPLKDSHEHPEDERRDQSYIRKVKPQNNNQAHLMEAIA